MKLCMKLFHMLLNEWILHELRWIIPLYFSIGLMNVSGDTQLISLGFTFSTIWTGRYGIKPINGPWTNTAILTSNRRGKNLKPSLLTTFRARLKLLALSIQCDSLPGRGCLLSSFSQWYDRVRQASMYPVSVKFLEDMINNALAITVRYGNHFCALLSSRALYQFITP